MEFKVLISGFFLNPSKVGGAEHFFYNLLRGFKLLGVNKYITVLINKKFLNCVPLDIKDSFNFLGITLRANRGLYDYLLDLLIDRRFMGEYDLIFSPNYITKINIFYKIKRVTTIHDFQYLDFPQNFSFKKRFWLYLSHIHTLKKADKVVFISNFVETIAKKKFELRDGRKYTVVYNPIDFSRFEIEKCKCGKIRIVNKILNHKYILTVAAQYPHKNLLTLVEAFKIFNSKFAGSYKLVLAGQLGKSLVGNYKTYQFRLLNKIDSDINIIITGYICDYCLGKLYKSCCFFVFPSVYEGFGMPPVEAMGFGKPTIVSNICSLPEVTLNKAIYVLRPSDVGEWVSKMIYCKENLEYFIKKFREESLFVRKFFSSRQIAKKYWKIFEEAINASKKKGNKY